MREGVDATSLVHPDLVRDTPYLTFDRSQTDAVPSAVLVKTKRLTCCRNSSMLLQSIKVGAVDPAGKAGSPGGDPLGGGIGQCGLRQVSVMLMLRDNQEIGDELPNQVT